jgi:hypothetical protein
MRSRKLEGRDPFHTANKAFEAFLAFVGQCPVRPAGDLEIFHSQFEEFRAQFRPTVPDSTRMLAAFVTGPLAAACARVESHLDAEFNSVLPQFAAFFAPFLPAAAAQPGFREHYLSILRSRQIPLALSVEFILPRMYAAAGIGEDRGLPQDLADRLEFASRQCALYQAFREEIGHVLDELNFLRTAPGARMVQWPGEGLRTAAIPAPPRQAPDAARADADRLRELRGQNDRLFRREVEQELLFLDQQQAAQEEWRGIQHFMQRVCTVELQFAEAAAGATYDDAVFVECQEHLLDLINREPVGETVSRGDLGPLVEWLDRGPGQ